MKTRYPFKFNSTWIKVEDCNALIKFQWALLHSEVLAHLSPLKAVLFKQEKLRPVIRSWEMEAKQKNDELPSSIKKEIHLGENESVLDLFCPLNKEIIKALYSQKSLIPRQKEETYPTEESCCVVGCW